MMTVHKLSAGDGYTYLTRQVASADQQRAGQSLAEYYLAHGNPPGVWGGAGAEVLELAGTPVDEKQMRALFGRGLHPDGVTKLGQVFPNYADLAPYPDRVATAAAQFAKEHGRSPSASEHNRIAAREARRGRRAVAGFDLVFTPVKSASLLWGLGGPDVRAGVEAAHHEAVVNALTWLEQHACFTRAGHNGVAQLDGTGFVWAAFDHRESRAGDPDLHTHVAIANKVQGVDGKWRSIDARGLYALGVAASERYNTRFEDALSRRLGVEFAERPGGPRDRRPIREVVGIPRALISHFSRRRALIEARYAELRADYRAAHGREPGRASQLRLAQQATLETREAKGAGRSLAEQVADWRSQAADVADTSVDTVIRGCLHRSSIAAALPAPEILARELIRTTAEQRATWTIWNLYAEAERLLRPLRFSTADERDSFTEQVITAAASPALSIRIAEPELVIEPPELTRSSDAQSVFRPHGGDRFTCSDILLAEDALVAAARGSGGPNLSAPVVDAALAIHEASTGIRLDAGQRALVSAFAISPAPLAVGIGPAGAGKTTAMRAFTQAWQAAGGRVVPLATSAKAAQVLSEELGLRAENLHKFLHEHRQGSVDDWFALHPGDVVLLDEGGMAGTLHLHQLLELTTHAGAGLRLLGDPAQLAAVDAGGALAHLEAEVGATHLTDLHRFTDPAEGAASLRLRAGDPAALGFYHGQDRIGSGGRDAMLEAAYDAWAADVSAGKVSVLIAATTADVTALNARARLDRVVAGVVTGEGVPLHDGNLAGVGDWVVTRRNARTLVDRHGRWVHNGDTWRVTRQHRDGSLTVHPIAGGGPLRLPASYVEGDLELGYACTAHRAQGSTTDTAHTLVTAEMTREALYVASTRARAGTRWYAAVDDAVDLGCHHEPEIPRTADELLQAILRRTGAETSASATVRAVVDDATNLRTLVARYDHAHDIAADAVLHEATRLLPPETRTRLLTSKGTRHLARVLASAASGGAPPGRILRAAWDLEPVEGVTSPALALATRIRDHPTTIGIAPQKASERPLPWLSSPEVGHPAWAPYLRERARLISDRATELGSLAASYREQYAVTGDPTNPNALGDRPAPDTRRESAYLHAQAELGAAVSVVRGTPPSSRYRPPVRRTDGPHLAR